MDVDSQRFAEKTENSRVLVFLFYRAFPIVLHRMMENSCLDDDCFQNVVLVSIPVIDPISHAEQDLLDSVYLACYEGYLNSLVRAEIPSSTTLPSPSPSSSSSSSSSVKSNVMIDSWSEQSSSSSKYVWVKSGEEDFVGIPVRGNAILRTKRWDYLRLIIHRLNENACKHIHDCL